MLERARTARLRVAGGTGVFTRGTTIFGVLWRIASPRAQRLEP